MLLVTLCTEQEHVVAHLLHLLVPTRLLVVLDAGFVELLETMRSALKAFQSVVELVEATTEARLTDDAAAMGNGCSVNHWWEAVCFVCWLTHTLSESDSYETSVSRTSSWMNEAYLSIPFV